MKKYILIIVYLLIFKIGFAQTPLTDPHWDMVWQDEFNYFNSSIWKKAEYCDHGEPQIYLDDNVYASNGNLILEINSDLFLCESNTPWCNTNACGPCDIGEYYFYTSGWVESIDPYHPQFGYIESRVKIPFEYGYWPAFWTWRNGVTASSSEGEIDIFEIFGNHPSDELSTNTHINYNDDNVNEMTIAPQNFDFTDWHTYSIEWSPSKFIFYIDGYMVRTLANDGIIDPVRIIFNMAINKYSAPPTTPNFQDFVYIDYVKVYELNDTDSNINLLVDNVSQLNNYNNYTKKSITIENYSNTITLQNSSTILRATDGIQINGMFSVPIGKELYLDVNPLNN